MSNTRLLFFHCLSPLHAGVGQGVDVVDLAIARERATGFPYLPGSSIKGALRSRSTRADMTANRVDALFGRPAGADGDAGFAGRLAFGDAQLLCLPVRSFVNAFAYVTSPYLLQRLGRDFQQAGVADIPNASFKLNEVDQSFVPKGLSSITSVFGGTCSVLLEDYNLKVKEGDNASNWAKFIAEHVFKGDEADQASFIERFVVVSDTLMSFLATYATEVVTRTSIDDTTGVVKLGQLWTEENLPAESILCSVIHNIKVNAATLESTVWEELEVVLGSRPVEQFGGNATVGRGQCKLSIAGS